MCMTRKKAAPRDGGGNKKKGTNHPKVKIRSKVEAGPVEGDELAVPVGGQRHPVHADVDIQQKPPLPGGPNESDIDDQDITVKDVPDVMPEYELEPLCDRIQYFTVEQLL